EVNHISALPQPTLTFLGVCLLREIEKNPEAKKLEDFEVSCILSNKSVLQQDQQAIRIMVSDLLTEAYDVCQTQGKSLSPQLFNSFLYHIGWPTAQQMQKIKEKEVSFKQVRDDNLSKFKVNELFDGAEKILFSPEIKAFNLPDLHKLTKVLHFEKMILLPSQDTKREMKKIKTR
ncbi:MAG: hypothetical protein IKQ99_03290, partial [Alphaproteobacteria bacterium]|nr:hypothetical protein [Alphaproteobacteria bacterium]